MQLHKLTRSSFLRLSSSQEFRSACLLHRPSLSLLKSHIGHFYHFLCFQEVRGRHHGPHGQEDHLPGPRLCPQPLPRPLQPAQTKLKENVDMGRCARQKLQKW